MQLAKVRRSTGDVHFGAIQNDQFHRFDGLADAPATLAALLHGPNPYATAKRLLEAAPTGESLSAFTLLAPIDEQEVWAAGVTYRRSKVAREEESVGAAQFYDKVYSAPRPELFFKATPARVIRPGDGVRVRSDSKWSVPEPEFALVVTPDLRIVGATIGNDMSARDIEGENPLYLPQAKIYDRSCSVGPVITLLEAMPKLPEVEIRLRIHRGGQLAFDGNTTLAALNRTPESLVEWLGKENAFPTGVILLTGTGIVPPDEFTLHIGDVITIGISGIGELVNPVVA
ncbi:fumarylacetoacetate hydrolase family protein [Tuwongella immobilis]|uniref:Fumarylacetoacetase-like C-terminal domain-containing protein n=1 Tax=Tuwongella immobilis TaxID=692036 RepID=A0A6C2YJ25_9BACT|nr:fumarylacetoacetate hydrolase family protein [Tuwongella immobilis]VIP01364.1 fumarylacetoacetate hydrolase : Probable 2-hydroxyhepta-2,4-diene-1,7-dioate isomaerase OS=Planctomyces maris DSM 8797 GN=PM8797T_05290 PE=4 SV=1: FAA_hydrolase [Tuwongella immobilis]VTR98185.1 fumarylacetoacetate hydrolase : Probable 2-hydroxyhepta-2,4-diene-1,7-dioate isomaerase OS=Planctomyces maris DSM 8797 GN=PM8797T_05290 PE=4 SV=1: FAA_hydrolase [Tuwongella immobilis]